MYSWFLNLATWNKRKWIFVSQFLFRYQKTETIKECKNFKKKLNFYLHHYASKAQRSLLLIDWCIPSRSFLYMYKYMYMYAFLLFILYILFCSIILFTIYLIHLCQYAQVFISLFYDFIMPHCMAVHEFN